VTGGRFFGYTNIRVDGHVERRIAEAEARVIREIFDRAAAGEGLKTIAKALNAAHVPTPRAQQGRPHGWSPSSVRDVLHRDTYRGIVIWNRTKKRDADGQQRQHAKPQPDWITIPAEPLRIVSDAVWQSVHARLESRQAPTVLAPPLITGRGIRRRYLLAGFGRCARCGGSMQAVSCASSDGRIVRYVCGTYWNRGATVCANGLMVDMTIAHQAVCEVLKTEVLRPRIIERALDLAVTAIRRDQQTRRPPATLGSRARAARRGTGEPRRDGRARRGGAGGARRARQA